MISNNEELSTYPTDIKLYEKIRVIGQGAFGNVFTLKIDFYIRFGRAK